TNDLELAETLVGLEHGSLHSLGTTALLACAGKGERRWPFCLDRGSSSVGRGQDLRPVHQHQAYPLWQAPAMLFPTLRAAHPGRIGNPAHALSCRRNRMGQDISTFPVSGKGIAHADRIANRALPVLLLQP